MVLKNPTILMDNYVKNKIIQINNYILSPQNIINYVSCKFLFMLKHGMHKSLTKFNTLKLLIIFYS